MSRLYIAQMVPPIHIADGTALANSTSEAYISPAPQHQFNANYFEAGKRLYWQAAGIVSATTGTNNMTLQLKTGTIGQAVGSAISLCSSGTITVPASASNRVWRAEGMINVRVGPDASSTWLAFGEIANLTANNHDFMQSGTFAPVGSIDGTVPREIRLSGTWSVANAANTIQVKTFDIWDMS